ncbi:MAG: hypothetical protein KC912_21120 [Proteobacteria bacterium]|nr:hypothetical protein [Pseudomonadota bacterium]
MGNAYKKIDSATESSTAEASLDLQSLPFESNSARASQLPTTSRRPSLLDLAGASPYAHPPDKDTSAPNPYAHLPDKDTPAPNPYAHLPDKDTSAPNPYAHLPDKDTSAPSPYAHLPDKDTSAPNPYAHLPDKDTSAPNPYAHLPDTGKSPPMSAPRAAAKAVPMPTRAERKQARREKKAEAEAKRVAEQTERVAADMPQSRKDWHAAMAKDATYSTVPLLDTYIGEESNHHRPGHLLKTGASTLPTAAPFEGPVATPGVKKEDRTDNRPHEAALREPRTFPEVMAARKSRGETGATFNYTGTHYASEASEYGTAIVDGRLTKGAETVDSRDATSMYEKDRNERHNFAMDASGAFYTADPLREMEATRKVTDPTSPGSAPTTTAERANHSSLVGGADVAAAGTMKVVDGRVEELHNGSGHYRPDLEHTSQAASRLIKAGAMSDETGTIGLMNPGSKKDTRLSTRELTANMHEGDWIQQGEGWVSAPSDKEIDDKLSPDAAAKMINRHSAQSDVLAELLQRYGGANAYENGQ